MHPSFYEQHRTRVTPYMLAAVPASRNRNDPAFAEVGTDLRTCYLCKEPICHYGTPDPSWNRKQQ